MSNPSPEPSAESLAEAREVLMRTPWPYTEGDIRKVALALDAAKRSSRREALGDAAEKAERHVCDQGECYDCRQTIGAEVRALMEAE